MRFAKAIATTLVSLVASFRDSQSVPGWRLLHRTMICAMAPLHEAGNNHQGTAGARTKVIEWMPPLGNAAKWQTGGRRNDREE